jgi:indoleamine 2,3-dioxygenase
MISSTDQREYLAHLESRASFHSVREFCTSSSGSPLLKALYILMVDQVRGFRNRHWNFTKSYIIERTDFALATGGSPIIKYLPNNLATTLRVLEDSYDQWTAQDEQSLLEHQLLISSGNATVAAQLVEKVKEAGKRAAAQRRMLGREVLQLTVEKDAKNAGVDESVRGMAIADPAFGATAKTTQTRAYSTNAHDDRALKRGMVGCDGVG